MANETAKVWKALVLGGGGAKGEFQLGVLEHLASKGCEFDFFSGVSVGALNVSLLAQYPALRDGVAALTTLWQGIVSDDDVYTTPVGGVGVNAALALFSEAGVARDAVFGSKPLQRLIGNHVTWERLGSAGKIWAVGVTSLTDGSYYLVTNDAPLLTEFQQKHPGNRMLFTLTRGQMGAIPDRVEDFILASASMPLLFPPVDIYGHRFVDGGLRDITPLSSAFLAARAKQCQRVHVVAVSTSPKGLPYRGEAALDSGREIVARSMDIMCHEILENDLQEAQERSQVLGAYLPAEVTSVRPDLDLGLESLDFASKAKREALRQHGREVAARTFTGPLIQGLK